MEEGHRKGCLNIACSILIRVAPTLTGSSPICGRNIKYKLTVAAWNVRTMLDRQQSTDRPARRTALITQELSRYNVDIVALSETRLAGGGSLTENIGGGYTFY